MPLNASDYRSGLANPQRVYNFQLVFTGIPGTGDGRVLTARAFAGSIPEIQNAKFETVHPGGFRIRHPGVNVYPGQWPCTFYEGIDAFTYDALKSWSDTEWDPETGAATDEDSSKINILVQMLDNNRVVTSTFSMNGSFLEQIGGVNLSGGQPDGVQIPAVFSYDTWTRTKP